MYLSHVSNKTFSCVRNISLVIFYHLLAAILATGAGHDFKRHDPRMVMEAQVKEFVSSKTGILEVTKIGKTILAETGKSHFSTQEAVA